MVSSPAVGAERAGHYRKDCDINTAELVHIVEQCFAEHYLPWPVSWYRRRADGTHLLLVAGTGAHPGIIRAIERATGRRAAWQEVRPETGEPYTLLALRDRERLPIRWLAGLTALIASHVDPQVVEVIGRLGP